MTLPKPFANIIVRRNSENRDTTSKYSGSSRFESEKTFTRSNSSISRRRSASTHCSNSCPITVTKVNPVLREINLAEEFDVLKTLNEGIYTKILLVKKQSDRLALKCISQDACSRESFLQEVSTNYFLSPHPNIVKSFNVAMVYEDYFLFPMEHAPFGNLSRFLRNGTLPEVSVKLIANQIASALEFMHSLKLVHRDVKPENVLVFKQNFSQVKLCDFGNTCQEKSLVTRTMEMESSSSSLPPEICQLVCHENYYTHSSADVWQVGILLFVCLTGSEPWDRADIADQGYTEYTDWLRRKSLRVPEFFLPFTPRLTRLLKRMLEPKWKKRCEIREIYKYLEDDWLCKMHRAYSFKRGALERKSSSSTNRSRSTNNASFRRRSLRMGSTPTSVTLTTTNTNTITPSPSQLLPPDEGKGIRKTPEDYDRRFVQQRIGKWVMEASVVPVTPPPEHDLPVHQDEENIVITAM